MIRRGTRFFHCIDASKLIFESRRENGNDYFGFLHPETQIQYAKIMVNSILLLFSSKNNDSLRALLPLSPELLSALDSLESNLSSRNHLHKLLKGLFLLEEEDDQERHDFLVFRFIVFLSMRLSETGFSFIKPQDVTQICSKLMYFVRLSMIYELVICNTR